MTRGRPRKHPSANISKPPTTLSAGTNRSRSDSGRYADIFKVSDHRGNHVATIPMEAIEPCNAGSRYSATPGPKGTYTDSSGHVNYRDVSGSVHELRVGEISLAHISEDDLRMELDLRRAQQELAKDGYALDRWTTIKIFEAMSAFRVFARKANKTVAEYMTLIEKCLNRHNRHHGVPVSKEDIDDYTKETASEATEEAATLAAKEVA